ncbi:MAG: hypothetical protein ACJAV1_003543 [Paraglaciecola sp.]|jgi:hypothetical protein
MSATEQQIIRRSTRLLAAVHELHKQGYQNLAIYTGMSNLGFHWRLQLCNFYDVTLGVEHLNEPIEPLPYEQTRHSSGEAGNLYFGWKETTTASVRELVFEKMLKEVMLSRRKDELELYKLFAGDSAFKSARTQSMQRTVGL